MLVTLEAVRLEPNILPASTYHSKDRWDDVRKHSKRSSGSRRLVQTVIVSHKNDQPTMSYQKK